MANSSTMGFQHRPLAVVCPLGWTRSGHLNHVLELLAGFDDRAGHPDACAELSLASNDEEWFPEGLLSHRGSQTIGNAFPGCAAVESLALPAA